MKTFKEGSNRAVVYDLLHDKKGISLETILRETGREKGPIRSVLDQLRAEGYVIRYKGKNGSSLFKKGYGKESKSTEISTESVPELLPKQLQIVSTNDERNAALGYITQLEQRCSMLQTLVDQLLNNYEQQSNIFQSAGYLEP